jgi:hypothetical protein
MSWYPVRLDWWVGFAITVVVNWAASLKTPS